jgi:CHAT domain
MRTITLEILRHGPPHNQLLSPLTQYLTICENHSAVTVHVPFEHNQFLYRLRALGYQMGDESRKFQIKDTARVLAEVLAEIPGLTAELNRDGTGSASLTHLRLIISASELALLPFELALAPNGFPGAGQPLLLQTQLPLCLTREIRRVPDEQTAWLSREPRILFAAAAPPGVAAVPVESHLLALRGVIDPWLKYYDRSDADKRRKRVEEHLVFLPQATADSIEQACITGGFTHVHILAHGLEMKEENDVRFGLALHDARDPQKADVVSGARLATILRATQATPHDGLARPAVVTIASCNSGNVGSVAGAGSSVAHAVHEAGVPMVVAGQFPLSFTASIRMVQILYEGLLWGTDPRVLLSDLRRRLHSELPGTHDWASITAYASLPDNFDEQLLDGQIKQAKRSIDAALNHADEAVSLFSNKLQSRTAPEERGDLLDRAHAKIDGAKKRMQELLRQIPARKSRISGLLASTEKRQAQLLLEQDGADDSIACLRKAIDYYWDAFLCDRTAGWAVVQYLSLLVVLQKKGEALPAAKLPDRDMEALWSLAHLLSLNDLQGVEVSRIVWAHANLVELNLLSLVMPPGGGRPQGEEAKIKAWHHTRRILAVADPDSFELYSVRRQILRYYEFFDTLAGGLGEARELAGELFDILPARGEDLWA